MNQPQSDSSGQAPREEAGEKSASDGRLLERVLLETATSLDASELGDEEWRALLGVARQHAGQPFSRDPVAFEMVETLLRPRFGKQAGAIQDWRPMIERIATTLVEDRPSFERLEGLWGRLCEAIR